MSITRHDDGSLTVPVAPGRHDDEVADAEGGEALPPHTTTSIIGEVLAEIDKRSV